MIVLRLTVGRRTQEVRSERPRILLGSAPGADVAASDAGWAEREAILTHAGAEVLLERPGTDRSVRLRVGDAVRLGRARVTLAGLRPLRADAALATRFGGYEEDLASLGEPPSPPPPAGPRRRPPPVGRPAHLPFDAPDFGAELVRQLRRTPFLAISLAVHVLVFLVLALIQDRDAGAGGADRREGLRSAVRDPHEAERLLEDASDPLPPPVPDLPDSREPPDESESRRLDQPDPRDQVLDALPERDRPPLIVGLNPSVRTAGARTGDARAPVRPEDLVAPFTGNQAEKVNARAAQVVREELGLGRGRRGSPLERLVRRDLLVVEGGFDHIGKVLEKLDLPFTLVRPMLLTRAEAPILSAAKVVFWNCAEGLPPGQQRVVARRLRAFVEGGGFLFTTDWAVSNVLDPAFPGYLGSSGPRSPLPEMELDIHPARGQEGHPLLRGVFRPGVQGRWWLEQASFDVMVRRPGDVTTLIEGPDLRSLWGRSPAVAVTFPFEEGQVLHVSGHYYQEAGNLAGTIAAHRLALNFVLLRLERD